MEALQRQAEAQMRRKAPEALAEQHGAKRQKQGAHVSEHPPAATAAGRAVDAGQADRAPAMELQRFDYSPLLTGDCGFLIHCNFRREKSATREAVTALAPFLTAAHLNGSPAIAEGTPVTGAAGEALTPPEEQASVMQVEGGEARAGERREGGSGEVSAGQLGAALAVRQAGAEAVTYTGSDADASARRGGVTLSTVKLGCNGLVMLRSSQGDPGATVAALQALLDAIAAGTLPPLQHCLRIIPVQTACLLIEADLREAAEKLCRFFAEGLGPDRLAQPISFGVSYKSRGPAERAAPATDPGADTTAARPVDRHLLLRTVAAAMSTACSSVGCAEVKVDLTAPQYGVMVEALPVAGGQLWCMLGVAPASMLSLKPRLALRTLCAVKR